MLRHSKFAILAREVDVSIELLQRLNTVEDRIAILQREVEAIRRELRAEAPAREPVRPARQEPFPAPPVRTAPQPPRPSMPVRPRRELDLSALLGPQALAWAGGVVTLHGVVFFFVLAVN